LVVSFDTLYKRVSTTEVEASSFAILHGCGVRSHIPSEHGHHLEDMEAKLDMAGTKQHQKINIRLRPNAIDGITFP